jgi:DNA-binding LacI/PurR family transcriptional regulator
MRDIARKIGVSHVTVSLAMRDNPRISVTMRRQIREAAEEMGYRPDPMLTALAHYRKRKSNPSGTARIAWINAWENPAASRGHKESDLYWKGASAAAEKYGYLMEELHLGEQHTPERLHRILSNSGIRGILIPPQRTQPEWGDFPWSEYSVVRFGRSLKTPHTPLVIADHMANTMLAFGKIRERGYRRIGFIADGTDALLTGHVHECGFLTAQRQVDESERLPVCMLNDGPEDDKERAIATWLETHKADAIITNISEIPVILESMGVKVPNDVALASITMLDPHMDAGIDLHPEEIGRVGFLMLNTLINDGSKGIPEICRQVLVEGSWVDGNSLPDRRDP